MFENETIKKFFFQNTIFPNKLLNLIIDSFSKIQNDKAVENFFPEKMIHELLESHHFQENLSRSNMKKSSDKNKAY